MPTSNVFSAPFGHGTAGEVTVQVKGLKEMDAALAELAMNIQKRYMAIANREGAMVIMQYAKSLVPIRNLGHTGSVFRELVRVGKKSTKYRAPGFLKASVRVWRARKVVNYKSTIAYHVGAYGDAFYGKFVEFGTSKMGAQPWLRPALDNMWQVAVEETAWKLRDQIRKNWNKAHMAGMTYKG